MKEKGYVSYDLAILLWKDGFLKNTQYVYDDCGWFENRCDLKDGDSFYDAPTYQDACEYLREIRNINVSVYYVYPYGWKAEIYNISKDTDVDEFLELFDKYYNTYYDAMEAGLIFILEKILNND